MYVQYIIFNNISCMYSNNALRSFHKIVAPDALINSCFKFSFSKCAFAETCCSYILLL